MKEVTEGVNNLISINDWHKKNRIQVSNMKIPLYSYVNLAKKLMQQHNDVKLCALGISEVFHPPLLCCESDIGPVFDCFYVSCFFNVFSELILQFCYLVTHNMVW